MSFYRYGPGWEGYLGPMSAERRSQAVSRWARVLPWYREGGWARETLETALAAAEHMEMRRKRALAKTASR